MSRPVAQTAHAAHRSLWPSASWALALSMARRCSLVYHLQLVLDLHAVVLLLPLSLSLLLLHALRRLGTHTGRMLSITGPQSCT
ncbi:hypothetical protein JZ751_007650, partial [Albula glossodonta]